MSTKTYWRGFIDAQNKTDYMDGEVICVSRDEKTLAPLAKLLGLKVREFRSGFYVKIRDYDELLPKKVDASYIRGFYDSRGRMYKDPLKITVTSTKLPIFTRYLEKELKLSLPKPQSPSKLSDTRRIILTGSTAEKFHEWLKLAVA